MESSGAHIIWECLARQGVVHALGVPRIHTDLRLGTRSDRDQRMADKVASVRQKLG